MHAEIMPWTISFKMKGGIVFSCRQMTERMEFTRAGYSSSASVRSAAVNRSWFLCLDDSEPNLRAQRVATPVVKALSCGHTAFAHVLGEVGLAHARVSRPRRTALPLILSVAYMT